MAKKFLLVLFLSFALLSSSVFAVGDGLSIVYPAMSYVPYNSVFEMHFQVFNSTNFFVTNVTTDCLITIYSPVGDSIVVQNLSFDSDFYYNFSTINYNQLNRDYSYVVYCNDSSESGFVSSSFRISEKGSIPVDTSIPVTIVFLSLITLFILIGVANKLPIFKWASFILAFYQTFMLMGYTYAYNYGLQVNWMFYFNFLLSTIVGFSILIFSFITKSINLMDFTEQGSNGVVNYGFQNSNSSDRFKNDKYQPRKK